MSGKRAKILRRVASALCNHKNDELVTSGANVYWKETSWRNTYQELKKMYKAGLLK